jgi:hypothetical protein
MVAFTSSLWWLLMRTATHAHANVEAASAAASAMRDHEGHPEVQRAAQRLNELLSAMADNGMSVAGSSEGNSSSRSPDY